MEGNLKPLQRDGDMPEWITADQLIDMVTATCSAAATQVRKQRYVVYLGYPTTIRNMTVLTDPFGDLYFVEKDGSTVPFEEGHTMRETKEEALAIAQDFKKKEEDSLRDEITLYERRIKDKKALIKELQILEFED